MSSSDGSSESSGNETGSPSRVGGSLREAPDTTEARGTVRAEPHGLDDEDTGVDARRMTMASLALGLALAGVLVWWMNRPPADEGERVAAATAAPMRPVTEAVLPSESMPGSALASASWRNAAASTPDSTGARDPDPLGTFIAQRAMAVARTTDLGEPAADIRRDAVGPNVHGGPIKANLAHVGADVDRRRSQAPDESLTIAQIVQRCQAGPADQELACRRRICAGYWGKADACPRRLAPASRPVDR